MQALVRSDGTTARIGILQDAEPVAFAVIGIACQRILPDQSVAKMKIDVCAGLERRKRAAFRTDQIEDKHAASLFLASLHDDFDRFFKHIATRVVRLFP